MLPRNLLEVCGCFQLIKYGRHFIGNNLVLCQTIVAKSKVGASRISDQAGETLGQESGSDAKLTRGYLSMKKNNSNTWRYLLTLIRLKMLLLSLLVLLLLVLFHEQGNWFVLSYYVLLLLCWWYW